MEKKASQAQLKYQLASTSKEKFRISNPRTTSTNPKKYMVFPFQKSISRRNKKFRFGSKTASKRSNKKKQNSIKSKHRPSIRIHKVLNSLKTEPEFSSFTEAVSCYTHQNAISCSLLKSPRYSNFIEERANRKKKQAKSEKFFSFAAFSENDSSEDKTEHQNPETPRIKRNREFGKKYFFNKILSNKKEKNYWSEQLKPRKFLMKNLKNRSSKKIFSMDQYCDMKDEKFEIARKALKGYLGENNWKVYNCENKTPNLIDLVKKNERNIKSHSLFQIRSNRRKKIHFPNREKIFRVLTRGKGKGLLMKSKVLDIEKVRLRKNKVICFKVNNS